MVQIQWPTTSPEDFYKQQNKLDTCTCINMIIHIKVYLTQWIFHISYMVPALSIILLFLCQMFLLLCTVTVLNLWLSWECRLKKVLTCIYLFFLLHSTITKLSSLLIRRKFHRILNRVHQLHLLLLSFQLAEGHTCL